MSVDGWTLEVDWLGKTWTWQGITASLTERLELYSDEPAFRSVSVSVIFEGCDVASKYAAGHRLEGSPARLVLDGVTHLRGRVDTPSFGALHVPVSFSVREVPHDDAGIFPPKHTFLRSVVDEDALEAFLRDFSGRDDYTIEEMESDPKLGPGFAETLAIDLGLMTTKAIGYLYPYVFGAAGTTGDGTTDHHHRIPAYPVAIYDSTAGAEKVIVAGHECDAGTVQIWTSQGNRALSDSVSLSLIHI